MRRSMNMTLGQLIDASADVVSLHDARNYGKDNLFDKEFGQVFYSDKVVFYNEDYHILELRIIMGTRTETGYSGYHAVRMAFAEVKGEVFESEEELMKTLDMKKDKNIGAKDSDINKIISAERKVHQKYGGIIIPCTGKTAKNGENFVSNGKVFYSQHGITLDNPCVVSCTCSSYKYTFAPYNWNHSAHLGRKPDKYQKRTTITVADSFKVIKGDKLKVKDKRKVLSGNRNVKVLNKNGSPGLCKHLMLAALLLLDGSILDVGNYAGKYNMRNLSRDLKDKMKHINEIEDANKKKQDKLGVITDPDKMKGAIGESFEAQGDRDNLVLQTYTRQTLEEARNELGIGEYNTDTDDVVKSRKRIKRDTVTDALSGLVKGEKVGSIYTTLAKRFANKYNREDYTTFTKTFMDLEKQEPEKFEKYCLSLLSPRERRKYFWGE